MPTLLIVTVMVFGLVRFIPGDAVELLMSQNSTVYKGDVDRVRSDLGLDEPIIAQYVSWLGGILTGDFGDSLWTRRPVFDELLTRMGTTLALGAMALTISMLIAIPVGTVAAVKRDTPADYLLRGFTVFGLAIPSFWLGTLIVVLCSKYFGWSPAGKYVPLSEDWLASLRSLLIPAFVLGLSSGATLMRYVRTQMLEVLTQDFMRTARAKGLPARVVITRHAFRNAMIPVITVAGLQVPILVGGSVVIETVFSIPGVGFFMVDAIQRRDYPVIQMVNLTFGVVVIGANLCVDLCYHMLDPRIRVR